jgi:ParB family transcriptional regulator, chromosome partitioning protein
MSRKALGRGLSALFTQVAPIVSDLLEVDIDLLNPTEAQPRHTFNEEKLKELAQSIKTNGVIQPLVVRRDGERFQIIAGERRWRAAALAGLKSIPCVVKDVANDSVLEISLIENIQREELNPIEEANAYKRLIEQLDVTQEQVAQRVGKDRSSIANALRLLKLPSEIQRLVEDEKLSMGHARALLAVESSEEQRRLASEIVEKSLSVRDAEREAKRATHAGRSPNSRLKELDNERANIAAAESKLSRKLQAPVKIRFGRSGGVVEIGFSSTDDLSRLFDLLVRKLD